MPISRFQDPYRQPRPPGQPVNQGYTLPEPVEPVKSSLPASLALMGIRDYHFRPRYWQEQALTYWENPRRVARYQQVMKAQPPGAEPVEWLDHGTLNEAYEALRRLNNNDMWWNWKPLPYDHPLSPALRQMAPPPFPMLASMQEEKYYQPTPQEELPTPGQMGLTDEQWKNLPRFQRMLISTLESPVFGGGIGFVAGGALGLAVGGPVGGVIGGVAGAGAGVYAQQHPESTLASLMMYLDLPAEWLEQGIGLGYQAFTPAEDKDFQDIDEFLKWLGAARQASTLGYTASPTDPVNLIARADIALDPLIDWLARETPILSPGWETPEEVVPQLAETGEVWQFGEPLPVAVDGDLAAVMLDARTRILAGEQPEKVIQEYTQMYGASGQLRELVGHVFVDPLNLAPLAAGKMGTFTATKLGNVELAQAFATTRGLTEAAQKYGTILRATKPVTELSEAGALTRWLTGVTKAGELKVLAPATEGGGLFRYLLGMKPSSRATEVVNTSAVNLAVVLAAVDGNEDDLVRIIKSLANTPDDVARELSMRSILAPDGAAIPMFLKDFGETADELLLKYKSTAWQRKLLENLAEATGKTDSEVLQMIANAGDAEVLLRQFVDAAREKGGGAADNIVNAYDDAKAAVSQLPPEEQLTGAKLQEMVQIFIDDELPHNLDVFRAQLYAASMDQAADWSARWFGVEPDPAWVRTSHMVKSAQSLLLLGLNPTYFVNNALNNLLTSSATGVFGLRSAKTIDQIWARAGLVPPRLRAGIGPVALGTEISYKAIREAMDAPGTLTNVTRFFNEKTRKVQIFSNMSMQAEQFASAQAYTTGFVQFMGRHWKEGTGFSRMPAPLERALGQVHPELPRLVYGAIKGGMNQAEIEAALWGGFTRRSLDGAIPSLADRLKAAGTKLTEADIRELLAHSGVDDLLREKLKNATTDADVKNAFDEVNQTVQDRLDKLVAQDLERTAAEVAGRISGGEGFPAVLELFDHQQLEFTERWFENFAEWEKAFQATENMTYGERNVVMQATAARQRQKWNRYYVKERTKFQGILKGLGIDGTDNRRIIDLVDEAQQNHKQFFDLRNKKNKEFFNTKFDNAIERKVGWDTLQDELMEAYNDMTSTELHIQDQLDEMMLGYLENKFGSEAREAGDQWRVGVGEIRKNMIDEMRAMRDALRTMPVDERRPAWLTFLHGRDGYLEQIGELFRRNVDGAHEMYNRLRGRGGAEPQPIEPGIPPPGGPAPAAGPPPPAAEGVAMPLMITHAVRALLSELGYSADDIAKMTPDEAWRLIQKSERGPEITGEFARAIPEAAPETPPVPEPEAPGPVQDLSPVGRKVELRNKETGVVAGPVKVEEGAAFVPVKMDKTDIVAWIPMEDVRAFEAPRQPVEVPQKLASPPKAISAENARLAAEHGIPLLDEEGKFLPGAEIHLRHAVRKYGGEEAAFIDRTTSLSDIPSELVEKALIERARVKAEEAAKPDELFEAVKALDEEFPRPKKSARVQELEDIIVRGDWDDLPEEVSIDLDEAISEMAAEVDIAEPGFKIFTEVAGQGATPEVTGVKSTYPDWWEGLGTKLYRDAAGTKYTAKAAVQQVLHDLAEGTVNPKNKAGDDYVLVSNVKAQLIDYLEPKRGYQIFTGRIDVTKWYKKLFTIDQDIKRVFIWDNPESLQRKLNEVNEIIAELSPYDYEDIQITMDRALDLQQTLVDRVDELGRLPPEELAQLVGDAERLARIELSEMESRRLIRDYQNSQGIEPSELFQDPKQGGFWEAGEETPLFTGAAQRARESVFRPEEAPTQGMMPGFEPQLKGAKPGGEVKGPLFDAAARAGLFRRQIRQKFVDEILSTQKEVLSGAWDAQTQADNVMHILDARANVWAKHSGREAWEYYPATFADVATQPVDATNDVYLLGQIEANKKTAGYKAFADGNKAVDANGDLIAVYHGTTHEFRQFDLGLAQNEAYFGRAFYFTDSIDDVNANYAGFGPDLTNRIQTLSERIAQGISDDLRDYQNDISQFYGMTPDGFEKMYDTDLARLESMVELDIDGLSEFIARKQVAGQNEGNVIPVHLRMENPAILGPGGKGTFIDFMDTYLSDVDYIADNLQYNPESYIDDIRKYYGWADDYEPDDLQVAIADDIYEIADEIAIPIEETDYYRMQEALRVALYEVTYPTDLTAESIMAKVWGDHPDGDSLDNIISTIKNRTDLAHAEIGDAGELAHSEVIRQMLEHMGYDGIIMDAHAAFNRMDGVYGAKHYVVWEPTQVKSVFNMGDFDMNNPDIYYQRSFAPSPAEAGYDSALRRLIVEEMPGRMEVSSLRKLIDGVEPSELEWSGVSTWLDEQADFVTKDEILRFLDEDKGSTEGLPLYNQKKGAVQFLDDGRAMIYALQDPDISTLVHELGHVFRMDLRRTIAQAADDATRGRLLADYETASKWAGVVQDADGEFLWSGEASHRYGIDSDQYRTAVAAEEKFARGFEEYLMMGKAPSPELIPVFEKFKEWMAHIYARVKGQLAGVSPEMKEVYDRLLVEYPEAADFPITTEMGRAKVPDQVNMFQPSPPQNTENFRMWFGESKTVNPDGSPMQVYHATRAEFEAFDPNRSRDFGFHFGTREQAEGIAGMRVPRGPYEGANIHEVYLSIQNPLRVVDFQWGGKGLETLIEDYLPPLAKQRLRGLLQRENELFSAMMSIDHVRSGQAIPLGARLILERYVGEFGSTVERLIDKSQDGLFEYQRFKTWLSVQRNGEPIVGQPGPVTTKGIRRLINEAIIAEFEDLGYDGMVYANEMEGIGDSWIAFQPEQVKSVRNTGEFSPVDPRMMHQGVPLEYENGYTTQLLYQDDIPDANMPLGEVQSHNPSPPLGEMQDEGFRNNIKPILNNLEALMTGPDAQVPSHLANLDTALDPGTMNQLRAYMGDVYGELGDTKLAGVRWAENRRDAALLNYSRRYGFDNFLTGVFPYQFWYTRTAAQWALRFIDKPGWLAQYARLRNFQRNTVQQPGFPRRLQDKMKIPVPFLPEWAGGGMYVDPFRQVFPFEQFARPWEQRAQEQNMVEKRAVSLLERWAEDDEEDPQVVKDALDFRAGPLWDKAINTAKLDVESDTGNPWDFINLIMSPSLPIGWGYQWLRGRKDNISQLPATRLIQNVSGALGANQGRGFNIEGPLRRALGLPEYDKYHDYRVDRTISDLVAEGAITPEEGNMAMVDQAGDAYLMAQQRAAQTQQIKYLGAPFGADLFPEGEQTQRALKMEYDKARDAWLAGQTDALTTFFEAHPEYESRMLLFMDDPEERMRFFLRSSIWDSWFDLPELHQKQLQEQLGDPFTQAFLNKETRSYDSIDTPTLAQWARVMKGVMPEIAPETPAAQVELAGEAETASYQAFVEERDRKFPNIGRILQVMYEAPEGVRSEYQKRFPEIEAYYQWRNQQFAEHPEILPYAISDQSKMYGAPQDIQVLYYQFQKIRDQRFPNIFEIQEQYFQLPKKQQKKFREQEHPELVEYWEWRRDFMRQYPNLIPYLMSEEALAEAVLGDEYSSGRSQTQPQPTAQPIAQPTIQSAVQPSAGPVRYREPGQSVPFRIDERLSDKAKDILRRNTLEFYSGSENIPSELPGHTIGGSFAFGLPESISRREEGGFKRFGVGLPDLAATNEELYLHELAHTIDMVENISSKSSFAKDAARYEREEEPDWEWETNDQEWFAMLFARAVTGNQEVPDYMMKWFEPYIESSGGSTSQSSYSSSRQNIDINQLDPALVRMLNAYYMLGEPLGSGAQKALQQLWESLGKPGKNFQEFIDVMLANEF